MGVRTGCIARLRSSDKGIVPSRNALQAAANLLWATPTEASGSSTNAPQLATRLGVEQPMLPAAASPEAAAAIRETACISLLLLPIHGLLKAHGAWQVCSLAGT